MSKTRYWYVDTVRHCMAGLEDRWDEKLGYYRIPQSTRSNGMLLLPLIVLLGEGEEKWRERILKVVERMVQSPPYDHRYHYFNWNMSQTGGEVHSAGTMTQIGLSFVLRYKDVLGIPSELRDEITNKVYQSLQRFADEGSHAKDSEFGMLVDEDGNPVDVGKERAERIARGLPENFSRLRHIGPSNQSCFAMRACVYAWLATGDNDYLDFVDLLWRSLLRDEEGHPPYRACFAEDYSFIYSAQPFSLWNYDQAMYDAAMYCLYADCVRVMRRTGRSRDYIERFVKNWGGAVFTRTLLSDSSCNMVFNTYGWERSSTGGVYLNALCHPVISVADLTPYDAEELKAIFERNVERLREWDFRYPFPPELGIRGWISAQEEERVVFPYELALMLLDNQEVLEIETKPYTGCLSSFAWREKNFVMQTPVYHATVIGTSPGYDGIHGIPTSGGEYVIRIPNGDYLLPLSDNGRASLAAEVEGKLISSAEITKYNATEWNFDMAAQLPDGTKVQRGTDYGPLLYDPKTEEVTLEVVFGDDSVRLRREIIFSPDRILLTDSLTALRGVTVEKAYSQIPIITVSPRNELPRIIGRSRGKAICIRPPYYMGDMDSDWIHHDQDYIQGLRSLEKLRVEYSHYSFEVSQLSKNEIRLAITPWEWQENRRMRADGKNLDYVWIWEPTRMKEGERRRFSYEIRPFSDEYVL